MDVVSAVSQRRQGQFPPVGFRSFDNLPPLVRTCAVRTFKASTNADEGCRGKRLGIWVEPTVPQPTLIGKVATRRRRCRHSPRRRRVGVVQRCSWAHYGFPFFFSSPRVLFCLVSASVLSGRTSGALMKSLTGSYNCMSRAMATEEPWDR